jgi:hypothetical protein
MPWQLQDSNRRRPRNSEPRPVIELMPSISIHELRHAIPRHHGPVSQPDVTLKYPDLAYLRLSASCLEIMGRNGYVQRFGIQWIPTHFGKHRAILVCSSCRGGAIRLFGHYGNYACRLPPGAVSVAKAKDRQSQATQRRKIAPQAWWLARHSRTNAIKAQMDAPQNLSMHSKRDPNLGSQSQSITFPQADRYSYLRLSRRMIVILSPFIA